MKFYEPILSLGLLLVFGISNAQFPDHLSPSYFKDAHTEKFDAANDIYIMDNVENTFEFTLADGATFTFMNLVKETWPEKNFILISAGDYNDLDDLSDRLYLTIATRPIEFDLEGRDGLMGIKLQRGKADKNPNRTIYFMYANIADMMKGEHPERLQYAVKNFKYLMENHEEVFDRNSDTYKRLDFLDFYKDHTLYVREDHLRESMSTIEDIQEIYTYPFEIVSQEQWDQAYAEKNEEVLLFEFVHVGYITSVDLIKVSDGTLIMTAYPGSGQHFGYDKTFFKKIMRD